MLITALVIVLGILSFSILACSVLCFAIDKFSVGLFFFFLSINFFRPFGSYLSKYSGNPPTDSWQYTWLASPEGLFITALLTTLALFNALIQFFRYGGVEASRFMTRQAKAYATTQPGSGVITTIVAAEITDEVGVKQVKAISEGSLEVKDLEESKE